MRVHVSDGNLSGVLKRFRPKPGARVEFVLSGDGLDVIANAAGYLTLARWCLLMAHPEMGGRAHPRWLYSVHHLDEAVGEDGAWLSPCGTGTGSHLDAHAISFYRFD